MSMIYALESFMQICKSESLAFGDTMKKLQNSDIAIAIVICEASFTFF